MEFLWLPALLLLLLVPALVVVYILLLRRRKKYAVKYASLSLVRDVVGRGPGIRRHIPPALLLLALAILIFALARPQMVVALPNQEGTVILTIDVSGSMVADDLKPSRMEAAKEAARAFIKKQPPTVQIGIVSFSDNAFTVQPPTTDQDALMSAINRLQPQRGTAIGRGIQVSLNAISEGQGEAPAGISRFATPTPTPTPVPQGQYAPAVIVLLTDGENNQLPDPLAIAQFAVDRGVRIYTVGVGSAEGTVIHVQGRAIRTRLDEATLQQIADLTGGTYYNASNEAELVKVYETLDTHFVIKTQKTEVTALFTAIGIVVLLVASGLSLWWFSRLI
ncbi:MAG: VWA domain-containing protein [Anaerolineae bacterium]